MASDVFTKHMCTYCQEEIKSLRVKCTECTSFELCLQCFSAGAEIGCHKKDHSYQFIDSVICDVFRDRSGWTGREELYLLNAIEHYSYGNWEDVSQHIGTRSPEEVKEEYINRFLGGDIGRHTWVPGLRSRSKLTDLTVGLEDDPQAIQILPSIAPTEKPPAVDIKSDDADQLDYMPLRDEFVMEYDNDAETLVSSLAVNQDDDELDTALKLVQVEMYTQRLRERARRHRIVHNNQLISQFFSNKDKSKKKASREERELVERLRPLCRGKEQLVVAGVLKQRKLSRKLAEYMRYRGNGLVKMEELPHFEQERQLKHSNKPGTTQSSYQHVSGSKKKDRAESGKSSSVNDGNDSDVPSQLVNNDHLLSATERQLCEKLDLTPMQYISIKALKLVDPEMNEDGEAGPDILDHLVSSGWVSSVTTMT